VAISTEDIRRLREETGAGVMECKRALEEAQGDAESARKLLKQRGALIAEKKAGREAGQGRIETYIHHDGRIGAMLELNCETDFVARSDDFRQLARDLAQHIAAMNPKRIGDEEESDGADVEPEEVLLTQAFVREPSQTIRDRINDTIGRVGERIVVRRFARFELGA
jgi:elongation factor Ts